MPQNIRNLCRCLTLASDTYKLGVLSYASPRVRLERKRVYLSANTHIPAQFVDSLFPLEITESTPKLCGNLGFVCDSPFCHSESPLFSVTLSSHQDSYFLLLQKL